MKKKGKLMRQRRKLKLIEKIYKWYDWLQAKIIYRLKKWPVILLQTGEVRVFKWEYDNSRWYFRDDERLSDKGHQEAIRIWFKLLELSRK